MEVTKEHIRHIMLYEYRKGNNASKSARNIQGVYGDNVVSERMCRRWFGRFRNGDFSLKDDERTGRPSEFDRDTLRTMVENNPSTTVRELAQELGVSHMTIHRHMQGLEK